MPATIISSTSPPLGIGFAHKHFRAASRVVAGVIVGSVAEFNVTLTGAETLVYATGGATSAWANMVNMGQLPGNAGTRFIPCARADQVLADNATGLWTLWGNSIGVDIFASATTFGGELTKLTGTELDTIPVVAQNAKIVGISHVASGGGVVIEADFDGWYGFGTSL